MAEPKKKLTSTRSGNRRSHQALKRQNLSTCSRCNEPKLAHHVCPTCGYYKNNQVLDFSKKDRKDKK